jgi:DNA topoisomerase I
MRTRRSDPNSPGYSRRKAGRGFSYRDAQGRRLPAAQLRRIRALAIPPAWRDVWISPDPAGHIQAVGTDAAGRRQYLYHPDFQARRSQAKFDHVRRVAARLPRVRAAVRADLARPALCREKVLAAAVSLLDHGRLRVGGDSYAVGADATFGVATLRTGHLRIVDRCAQLRFPAKGGTPHRCVLRHRPTVAVLAELREHRRPGQRLFAWPDGEQERWHKVHSDDINGYLTQVAGVPMTAKDFRTWHATVRAAQELAERGRPASETARRRVVAQVVRDVAEELDNTPAVARASYIDPQVIDEYHAGRTVAGRARTPEGDERETRELLD